MGILNPLHVATFRDSAVIPQHFTDFLRKGPLLPLHVVCPDSIDGFNLMSAIVAKQRHAASEQPVKKAAAESRLYDSCNIAGTIASKNDSEPASVDIPPEFSPDSFSGADPEDLLFERSDFQFRFASDHGRRNRSSALIQRMYAWRGYKCDGQVDPDHDADEVTLQACRDEHVFGTLTVCFDTTGGLAADALYRNEIDAYRKAGAKVCELTRLAVDPEYGSKEVLGALFHLAYIQLGVMRGRSHIFIEVNPRHVSFYRRMLNFRQIGECRTCPRVDAPAVLLHVPVAYVAEQIALCGGHPEKAVRSLYPYFFSSEEEQGITRRLAGLGYPDASAALHGRGRAPGANAGTVNL
jgi:hypothetical protein